VKGAVVIAVLAPSNNGVNGVGANPLEIEEVNKLIHAVDERLDSVRLAREVLDEVEDAIACRELDAEIRDLKDQQRMLSKRWRELTEGFLSKE
jgi:hypothetical protein